MYDVFAAEIMFKEFGEFVRIYGVWIYAIQQTLIENNRRFRLKAAKDMHHTGWRIWSVYWLRCVLTLREVFSPPPPPPPAIRRRKQYAQR